MHFLSSVHSNYLSYLPEKYIKLRSDLEEISHK